MENPVLLALPQRRTADEPARELLHAITMGSSPSVESALLRELLHRSPGLLASLTDPAEVHENSSAPAAVHAYKHRLQAIRCEFVNARIRAEDLEIQLTETHYEIHCLKKHVAYLDGIIEQMRASRGWKLVEKCSRMRQSVSRFLSRLRRSGTPR